MLLNSSPELSDFISRFGDLAWCIQALVFILGAKLGSTTKAPQHGHSHQGDHIIHKDQTARQVLPWSYLVGSVLATGCYLVSFVASGQGDVTRFWNVYQDLDKQVRRAGRGGAVSPLSAIVHLLIQVPEFYELLFRCFMFASSSVLMVLRLKDLCSTQQVPDKVAGGAWWSRVCIVGAVAVLASNLQACVLDGQDVTQVDTWTSMWPTTTEEKSALSEKLVQCMPRQLGASALMETLLLGSTLSTWVPGAPGGIYQAIRFRMMSKVMYLAAALTTNHSMIQSSYERLLSGKQVSDNTMLAIYPFIFGAIEVAILLAVAFPTYVRKNMVIDLLLGSVVYGVVHFSQKGQPLDALLQYAPFLADAKQFYRSVHIFILTAISMVTMGGGSMSMIVTAGVVMSLVSMLPEEVIGS